MLICLGYCAKDRDQAERLGQWLEELGALQNHTLMLWRDAQCPPVAAFERFAGGEHVISDDTWCKWPESANNVFRKIGKHVEYTTQEPFLYLEADAVPLRATAFDEIEAEYRNCGKPFLGDRMADPGTMPHMSAVGVYPGALSHHAGSIYQAFEDPFDAVAGNQIIPNMVQSELIFQAWKCPPFASWEDFEAKVLSKRPKCALFHSDKSCTLIEILRQRRNGIPTKAGAPDVESEGVSEANSVGVSTNDVKTETQTTTQPALSTSSDPSSVPVFRSGIETSQTPWQDRKASIAEIQSLAARLKEFQGEGSRNAAHVRFVRVLLHEAGVIELGYRYKKRKKWRKK